MQAKTYGDWDQLGNFLGGLSGPHKTCFDNYMYQTLTIVGYKARAKIHEDIKARKYKPNAPQTLKQKSPKDIPLIDTGQLMRSVTVDDRHRGQMLVFVGILKTERHKDRNGRDVMAKNIALELHEGAVHGNVRIPPRPFIRQPLSSPTFQGWAEKKMVQSLRAILIHIMQGGC